jgi:hypothetical protein
MTTKPYSPYEGTKVSYLKTQGEIAALLDKQAIQDTRFATLGSKKQIVLEFVRLTKFDNGGQGTVGVQIIVPNVDDKNRDQKYRMLFYWLKTKLEAVQFGVTSFMQEFFAHLVIVDSQGNMATMYDALAPGYVAALEDGRMMVPSLEPWTGPRQLGEGRRESEGSK